MSFILQNNCIGPQGPQVLAVYLFSAHIEPPSNMWSVNLLILRRSLTCLRPCCHNTLNDAPRNLLENVWFLNCLPFKHPFTTHKNLNIDMYALCNFDVDELGVKKWDFFLSKNPIGTLFERKWSQKVLALTTRHALLKSRFLVLSRFCNEKVQALIPVAQWVWPSVVSDGFFAAFKVNQFGQLQSEQGLLLAEVRFHVLNMEPKMLHHKNVATKFRRYGWGLHWEEHG